MELVFIIFLYTALIVVMAWLLFSEPATRKSAKRQYKEYMEYWDCSDQDENDW